MSEKTKKLLEGLKSIAQKETKLEEVNYGCIHSNLGGDRMYQNYASVELINKDFSKYKGKINKRSITCQDVAGNNFRSYVYETADGRWFDRAGLPIKKPTNLVGNNDDSEEESTIEVIKERLEDDADGI